jgi:hypothetical protein
MLDGELWMVIEENKGKVQAACTKQHWLHGTSGDGRGTSLRVQRTCLEAARCFAELMTV